VAVADLPRRGISDLEPWHLVVAHRLGGVLKPVVMADTGADAGAWVGPAFVPQAHPFASVRGVTNILSVGRGDSAVLFSGPGAGPAITAATVIDDVVEAASAHGSRALAATEIAAPVGARLRTPLAGAWFLALDGVTSTRGEVAEFLAANHLPALSVSGDGTRLGFLTAPATHAVLLSAIDAIESTGVHAQWWPVLEVAHG